MNIPDEIADEEVRVWLLGLRCALSFKFAPTERKKSDRERIGKRRNEIDRKRWLLGFL